MITFLGDVALIDNNLKSNYKPSTPYVFNLEYVLNSDGLTPTSHKINLRSNNSNFIDIFGADPIAVNLANNHIYDYKKQGLDNTIQAIKDKGVGIIGFEPYYPTDNICMLSYMLLRDNDCFGYSREKAEQDIKKEKEKNPNVRIIVQMHWGIENHPINNAKQTNAAHELIDMGADLIIGHHPHCIQPIELYKEKYIFYSLGNLLFGIINQPSHYDENGIPTRKYRFKWRRWNRRSLAVIYDENSNTVSHVDELYQKSNSLSLKKSTLNLSRITKKYRPALPSLIYNLRKYYLFFASNAFVDGKLFDMQALKSELGKK